MYAHILVDTSGLQEDSDSTSTGEFQSEPEVANAVVSTKLTNCPGLWTKFTVVVRP